MSENRPQRGPEESQPETHSERPEANARELGCRGISAASQPDEALDMASSPEPKLQASKTVAFRLSYEDRRRINEPKAKPEQPPESPAPWGKDFPMRRSGGKSNS
jgi:hypothetical protein